MATKIPSNLPPEKLPSIFRNWNKQSHTIELTKAQVKKLLNNKLLTIPAKIFFPNPHNNYLLNKLYLEILITACDHEDCLIPISDLGEPLTEEDVHLDSADHLFFRCKNCGIEILL